MQIFVHRDDQEYGPYSEDQIRVFLIEGNVTEGDLCRVDEDFEWSSLRTRLDYLFLPKEPDSSPLPPESTPLEESESASLSVLYEGVPSGHDEGNGSFTHRESEVTIPTWDEIARPPLIERATASSTSKIMMAIEAINREDYEKALNLFHASLEETHTVASGWLGIAYVEALLTSIDRNTIENIRHAVNQAHHYCPHNQRIFDHHGTILSLALRRTATMAILASDEYFAADSLAQRGLQELQNSATSRDGAVAMSTVAAVLGARSKGVVGQVIGFGIAANQTRRAIDAHVEVHQNKLQVEDYQTRSKNARDLAVAFLDFGQKIISEAKQFYFQCAPVVQSHLDSDIKGFNNRSRRIEDALLKDSEAKVRRICKEQEEYIEKQKSQQVGCAILLVIVILVAIIFLIVLANTPPHD